MTFPQPVYMAGMHPRWRLSDIERFEKGYTDRTSADEIYFSATDLAKRYQISRIAVWKRAKDARESAAA